MDCFQLIIPKHVHLLLNKNTTLSLETVLVRGILEFESGSMGDERAYYLQFNRMHIDGGLLIAGQSGSNPLKYATLVLHLSSQPNETLQPSDVMGESLNILFYPLFGNSCYANRLPYQLLVHKHQYSQLHSDLLDSPVFVASFKLPPVLMSSLGICEFLFIYFRGKYGT